MNAARNGNWRLEGQGVTWLFALKYVLYYLLPSRAVLSIS